MNKKRNNQSQWYQKMNKARALRRIELKNDESTADDGDYLSESKSIEVFGSIETSIACDEFTPNFVAHNRFY